MLLKSLTKLEEQYPYGMSNLRKVSNKDVKNVF